jgi:signal transduction histidine kinase
MSLNGFNRVMRRQLVDMADWVGLAIVKESVELHGGNVGVKSDGIGKGAAFTCAVAHRRSLF